MSEDFDSTIHKSYANMYRAMIDIEKDVDDVLAELEELYKWTDSKVARKSTRRAIKLLRKVSESATSVQPVRIT